MATVKKTLLAKLVASILEEKDINSKVDIITKNVNVAIDREIAILRAELITAESLVEKKKEELDKARVNYGKYENFDHDQYILKLSEARNALTKATNDTLELNESIIFLQSERQNLNN